jgi:hypothetical protein
MYGVAALFGHAVTLDAAKNVSLKKFSVSNLKIVLKSVRNKKNYVLSAISTASTTEGYSMLL